MSEVCPKWGKKSPILYHTFLLGQMKQLSLKTQQRFQFSEYVSMFQTSSSAIMIIQLDLQNDRRVYIYVVAFQNLFISVYWLF